MNLFHYINLFWQEDAKQPFSVSEAALYFYLLWEANTQRWKMPIRCNTTIICFRLKTSRQNVEGAREKLQNRNMISFEKGTGKDNPATYELLTSQFTGQLRDSVRGQLRDELRDNYNKENKNKDEKETSERPPLIPILEIKTILSQDKSWQEQVIQLFEKDGIHLSETDLAAKIDSFFLSLEVRKIERKTESDCRMHFINWLKKSINNNNYEERGKRHSDFAVIAAPEKDYEKPF